MVSTSVRAPTVDTEVNFWPGIIDMLTSLLMFFMLIYFVQHNVNPASLATEIARQKQQRFDALFQSELADEIRSGVVVLKPDVNLLQITFGEGILFQSGQYALQPRGAALLRRMAAVIHRLDATSQSRLYDQIQIEGHTDSTAMLRLSYPRDNWELSTARALAVLRFLSERCDPPLDERTLSANGYAHTRPAHRQRARNRRIEVRIYFSGLETK